jgi:hypothetical protein
MLTRTCGRSGRVCKVTFRLPPSVQAKTAAVCGDFNNWDPSRGFMERCLEGGFILCLLLHPGREYRFCYLIDGKRVFEPPHDDPELSVSIQGENSVLVL